MSSNLGMCCLGQILSYYFFFIFQAISLKQNKLIDYVAAEADVNEHKQEFGNNRISIPVSGSSNEINDFKNPQSYKEFVINIDKRLASLENNLEKLSMAEYMREQIKQSVTDVLKELLCIREM